jgi:hypothetical protein
MTTLLTSLLLTSLLIGAAPTDGPQEPAVAAPARVFVDFVELAAAPELWLGETVDTIVQVRDVAPGTWEGFLSGLSPRSHVALDVWADSQLLWDADEFNAPVGRVYVEPLALIRAAVASAFRAEGAPRTWGRHTRLRAVVRVEAYTAGRGWIVLLAAEPTAEQVPEGTVLHAIRGLALVEQEAFELAASELEKALLPPLPEHARRPLEVAHERARAALEPRTRPAARRNGSGTLPE